MNSRFVHAFIVATIVALGLSTTITALMMLGAPQFFFDNIGTFAPYNRHYIGDLGAFTLPLGLGMLWAARNPMQHRLMILVAVGANLMHTGNHAYDDILLGTLPSLQTVILLVGSVLLAVALLAVKPQARPVGRAVA
jgi:hypothetical protein